MEEIGAQAHEVWSSDSVTDACSLLLAMSTTDFVAALVITKICMGYLRPLTCSLQAETKDIIVVDEISTVQKALQNIRSEIHFNHDKR